MITPEGDTVQLDPIETALFDMYLVLRPEFIRLETGSIEAHRVGKRLTVNVVRSESRNIERSMQGTI